LAGVVVVGDEDESAGGLFVAREVDGPGLTVEVGVLGAGDGVVGAGVGPVYLASGTRALISEANSRQVLRKEG
jgi:hypothetical protein